MLVFAKKVSTEANCAYIYIYSKSDDFPIQMYSLPETLHGPQLGPYIPCAGGQDDQMISITPTLSRQMLFFNRKA